MRSAEREFILCGMAERADLAGLEPLGRRARGPAISRIVVASDDGAGGELDAAR